MAALDLNADLGEGAGEDAAMLALVTSANVACGFHAGDAETMRATCAAAHARGVVVGAHVSYRDRAGFGRRETGEDPSRIESDCAEQLAALAAAAGDEARFRSVVRYVKPHGALYHRCAADRAAADAVVGAARAAGVGTVLGPPGSQLLASATTSGLTAVTEGFADRRYVAGDGGATLLSRDQPGALLGPAEAAQQALLIATRGAAIAQGGAEVAVPARSICLHGDTPAAAALASAVRAALETAGVELRAFA